MPTNSEGLGTGIEENPIGFSSPDVIDREGLSVFVLSIDACRRASFLGGGGGGASGEEAGETIAGGTSMAMGLRTGASSSLSSIAFSISR